MRHYSNPLLNCSRRLVLPYATNVINECDKFQVHCSKLHFHIYLHVHVFIDRGKHSDTKPEKYGGDVGPLPCIFSVNLFSVVGDILQSFPLSRFSWKAAGWEEAHLLHGKSFPHFPKCSDHNAVKCLLLHASIFNDNQLCCV